MRTHDCVRPEKFFFVSIARLLCEDRANLPKISGSRYSPCPTRQDVRPTRADRSPEPSFAIRGEVEYGNER